MKKFSTAWKSSKRPGKQRKYKARAPYHLRSRFMSTNLSKELRKKYGKRSMPIRKGDVARIISGKFKKKTGKVAKVDRKRLKVEIEGIQMKKQDGSKANVKFSPSMLQITEIYTEDRKRGLVATAKETKSEKKPEEKKNAP